MGRLCFLFLILSKSMASTFVVEEEGRRRKKKIKEKSGEDKRGGWNLEHGIK